MTLVLTDLQNFRGECFVSRIQLKCEGPTVLILIWINSSNKAEYLMGCLQCVFTRTPVSNYVLCAA